MVKNNLTNFVKYGVISYALSFCRFWCLSSVTQAMWVAQNLKANKNTGQNGSTYSSTITKMDSVGNFRTSAKTNADVIFFGQTMPKSKTCLYLCLAFES